MKSIKIFFRNRLVSFIMFLTLLSFIFTSFNVNAHSPSSIMLSYNKNTKELTVDITHEVSDSSTHYVKNI